MTTTFAEKKLRITNAEAAILRAELLDCAATFERYANIHSSKGTEEGLRKAAENAALAASCREVLKVGAGKVVLHELSEAHIRIKVLEGKLDTPLFHDFTEAVKREAAHQVERWGKAHDRSKSAENWFWLVGFLAGKALRSAITGDKEKAQHHTISSAAALMQWHAAITADKNGAGVGEDEDLRAKEES